MPPIIAMDPAARANLHLIDHPLVQHKLTLMRDRDASRCVLWQG
jgi:uracil phosphoribosyltransferase